MGTNLEVAQLSELLPAVIQLTYEWFELLVHNLMGSHVASLCKAFAASVTLKRSLASMTTLVGLNVERVSSVILCNFNGRTNL